MQQSFVQFKRPGLRALQKMACKTEVIPSTLVLSVKENQMPIGAQALKAKTLNAKLQHVQFENDTMNPVKNDKVGCNGSMSVATDQTFMLTASQREKERFMNRYLLTLTIISARIRLNALRLGRSSEYGLFA